MTTYDDNDESVVQLVANLAVLFIITLTNGIRSISIIALIVCYR